jgi:hypothetical protein
LRQIYQIGCAPRPGLDTAKNMTKDDATLNLIETCQERFPDSFIVVTYIRKEGNTHNFIISVDEDTEDSFEGGRRHVRYSR